MQIGRDFNQRNGIVDSNETDSVRRDCVLSNRRLWLQVPQSYRTSKQDRTHPFQVSQNKNYLSSKIPSIFIATNEDIY